MSMRSHRIAILGDSRVFDTYYATAVYGDTAYGYHKTFPHLLQRSLARRPGIDIDCVHIPDHFRGRTIQNNILRLALIDPSAVVLCDGIWESLISKRHFIEHVERVIGLPGADTRKTSLEYSPAAIVSLFEAGQLALSPAAYAERVAVIASWFVRRRRKALWLTTPIPPKGHRDGLHFAGNYRPFPGWHEVLGILNRATAQAAREAGAEVLDLDQLMRECGGAEECLIDQWHFSAAFHAQIADELVAWACSELGAPADDEAALSSRVMLQGPAHGLKVHLIGTDPECENFLNGTGGVVVVGASAALPSDARTSAAEAWIILDPGPLVRIEKARTVLAGIRPDSVVLFPEDLSPLDNPAVSDRSTFGSFR